MIDILCSVCFITKFTCVWFCYCHVCWYLTLSSPWLHVLNTVISMVTCVKYCHLHSYLCLILSSPWLPVFSIVISMVTCVWYCHLHGNLCLILSSPWLPVFDTVISMSTCVWCWMVSKSPRLPAVFSLCNDGCYVYLMGGSQKKYIKIYVISHFNLIKFSVVLREISC